MVIKGVTPVLSANNFDVIAMEMRKMMLGVTGGVGAGLGKDQGHPVGL